MGLGIFLDLRTFESDVESYKKAEAGPGEREAVLGKRKSISQ